MQIYLEHRAVEGWKDKWTEDVTESKLSEKLEARRQTDPSSLSGLLSTKVAQLYIYQKQDPSLEWAIEVIRPTDKPLSATKLRVRLCL